MPIPYDHVDAFTSTPFAGNPAGVCILDAFPSDRTMQQIAAENRHSETAFVVPRAGADFDLRWFTPQVEDDLCGHATLASAYVLALRGHDTWPVRFHTQSGVLTVERDHDSFELDFPAWPPAPCDPPPELLPALGLKTAEILRARDYLVVVENTEQVRSLKPNIDALAKLDIGIGGTIVTAPGAGDVDYFVRFFAPSVGVPEDPATGSIQCTLVPYWSARLGKHKLHARQLSARGGELRCKLAGDRVKIAGQACLYLQGTIEPDYNVSDKS
ncbi:MAG TPA: PhzF family phenazine biosynthesis protein [Ardenticatenaceae bacterium]|nr:PhzF family phenazine biosynthesis protein [Ardenticatenaceae bacterium]